ncbi:tRNA preQ1(34) S-adenosylmethionine ribosyltransferase-isomerase QueA [Evansella cellulosilytica]|uniref:S-adenosylmethionine:tRNA ribosyltransferase-isomerase n=1 Tax=Evansella cellulosilytica (strain ATCC 21833 / DSM 2522 / FERM P-1141 / JCM 9156 / N-4) TaxID=649639 RepID=E6TV72_EVAC2|nr:tRNA preQ1(34) S-adenosylmethionine ribosyltransferase-isomerase QueA [Evansella cellulosilytica]ADU29756.1 S-adenosylmethionine/tRNA-ribosyltransferase-isomerase [Evansella cellulosilytica DSM 2522]
MDVTQFDFHLPEELIAQTPLADRTASRLLVLNRENGSIEHRHFKDLLQYFSKGDVLVLNNTKVLPARLFGIKEDTGAKIELLLLREESDYTWEALVKPAKRVKIGTKIVIGEGKLIGKCVEELPEGIRKIQFEFDGIFNEILDELGEMPLPPYIQEQLDEKDRYQTVFAKHSGSAAAPTAGLHFTKELLQNIEQLGVHIVFITLHVGLGTFRPVAVENVKEHTMHEEYYDMTSEAASVLNEARSNGNKIIAVGTTSVRTLETIASKHDGAFTASSGWTNIFIYPGYQYKAIDGMITNFHLPKSTLVMLVSAFAGRGNILSAYNAAVEKKYRFFSFGDAMLII